MKPLEPMAMERAVIGSDVGGIRELIEDGDRVDLPGGIEDR